MTIPTNAQEEADNSSEDSAVLLVANPSDAKTSPFTTQKQQQLKKRSAAALDRLRRFLKFYVNFVSTASHQDQALKVLQWSLWLVAGLVQKDSVGLALRKFSGDISLARYATRLLGLPAALQATWTNSWASCSKRHPEAFARIGRLLGASMVGYYPTEYAAYAIWMLPAGSPLAPRNNRTAERLSAWSCRFWFVYICAEMVQGALQWKELRDQSEPAAADALTVTIKNNNNDDALTHVKLQFARNALFLLPCIHWSLPNWDRKPWLSETAVNSLMWLESITCLYQSVRSRSNSSSSHHTEPEETIVDLALKSKDE